MLILITLFLLSKTQNDMSLSSPCQQTTFKNCQNVLAEALKDQYIRTKIKQKVRVKTQQAIIGIFSNKTLWELTDCVDLFKPR